METALRRKLANGVFEGVSAARSNAMGAVRGKGNKTTERVLRFALVRAGVKGWTLHADLPGRPDFYFPRSRVVVFTDGCFWHGCRNCGHVPKTRSSFWGAKIRRNRERDRERDEALRKLGVTVLRFWEHELRDDVDACVRAVRRACSK